ncbi:MAG: arsenate reductase [Bacteroidota bacterium]
MIIYGIKNCDTMKKAFTWLEENGVAYTFHDYKEKGITKQKIEHWLKHAPLTTIVNLKSTTYRSLSDTQKKAINNPAKAIKLMMEHTSLIKRPVVETGHEVLVGFDPEHWDKHV